MKIAINQPYFFPYLGYFQLIKHTDMFILFDTVQFMRHGWIERNRVLHPNEGWQYVQVPLMKMPRETPIMDMRIDKGKNWTEKILAQIPHYRKHRAPYYTPVLNLLKEIFSQEYDDIVTLNQRALTKTCEYLGMKKQFPAFSQMGLPVAEVHAPDEWALNISKALGNVTEYWNLPGGEEFFDVGKYEKNDLAIRFIHPKLREYRQFQDRPFEPGLSVIDVMMFNSPETINEMLDDFT